MRFRLPRGANIEGEHLKLKRRVKLLEEKLNRLEQYIQSMEGPQ